MSSSLLAAAKGTRSLGLSSPALREFAYEGVLVAVLCAGVFVQLASRSSGYASQTVLALEPGARAVDQGTVGDDPAGGRADGGASALRTVERLMLQVAASRHRTEQAADGSMAAPPFAIRIVDNRKLVVTCRGGTETQANCAWLARQVVSRMNALRIVRAATPASLVVTPASKWLGIALGFGGGVLWTLSRAAWQGRSRRRERASLPGRPSQLPRRPSNAHEIAPGAGARPIRGTTPSQQRAMSAQRNSLLGQTALGLGPQALSSVEKSDVHFVTVATAEAIPAASGHALQSLRPDDAERSARSAPGKLVTEYDATHHWSPHPAVSAPGPWAELESICRQTGALSAKGCVVVLVSSERGMTELKSELAAQLAWMLAESRRARVLLLDCDCDYPAVHRVLQVETPPFKGFSQQLYARVTAGTRTPWAVARCAPGLHVLPEGRVRTRGLLATVEFSSALAELRRCYDAIVVDGPALDSGIDTRALDGMADGVVFPVLVGAQVSSAVKRASEAFGHKPMLWIIQTHDVHDAEHA